MSALADNPAAFRPRRLCMAEQANKSLPTHNARGGLCSSLGVLGSSKTAAMTADFFHQDRDENFAPTSVCRLVSRLLLGHGFGPVRRPAARRSSASATLPFGLRFPSATDPP